jgi:hypothetical protein
MIREVVRGYRARLSYVPVRIQITKRKLVFRTICIKCGDGEMIVKADVG